MKVSDKLWPPTLPSRSLEGQQMGSRWPSQPTMPSVKNGLISGKNLPVEEVMLQIFLRRLELGEERKSNGTLLHHRNLSQIGKNTNMDNQRKCMLECLLLLLQLPLNLLHLPHQQGDEREYSVPGSCTSWKRYAPGNQLDAEKVIQTRRNQMSSACDQNHRCFPRLFHYLIVRTRESDDGK